MIIAPDDSALGDDADIEDVSAFEWQSGEGGMRGLFRTLARVTQRKRFWLAILLLAAMIIAIYAQRHDYISFAATLAFLRIHPVFAPIAFVTLYAVLSLLLIPTLPLNLAAGVLWGWFWGTGLALLGVVIGASIAFLIARYLGREFVARRLQGRAWQLLWQTIEKRGWKAVAFARVNPIFPSAPLNYFFGLTAIRFWPYFFSTLLFILPPSLFFSLLGDSLGGIVLNGSAKNLVSEVLLASAALSGLVILKITFQYLAKKNSLE